MITDMLKGVITKGSGNQAKINGIYQAGKTGTVKYSNEELASFPSYRNTPKDSWFVGYARDFSISVWTGYDNLKDGKISDNGQFAAQVLYREMMKYLMQDVTSRDWDKPDDVVVLGKELYIKGHEPKVKRRIKPPYNRRYYYTPYNRYYQRNHYRQFQQPGRQQSQYRAR